jgi:uncharacterized protein YdaU (DUF1376 family)
MSFAYLALFTGDYLRDTRHLTPSKHGIYLLLLMHCWDSKGPAPLDEQECAGICNCRSSDEIESLRYVLGRFFVRMDDGWYNPRMQREIEKMEAVSGARSTAGKAGAIARKASAKQMPSKCQAIAKQVPLSSSSSSSSSLSQSPKSEALASSDPESPPQLDLTGVPPPRPAASPSKPVKINFNFATLQWEGIEENIDKALAWQDAYPAVPFYPALDRMRAWLIANPDKRKVRYDQFIQRWMAREQDKPVPVTGGARR